MGLIQFLLLIAGIGALGLLGYGLGSMTNPEVCTLATVVIIAAYVCVLLIRCFHLANTVFNTALYAYAATGQIPAGYTKDVLDGAFKTK